LRRGGPAKDEHENEHEHENDRILLLLLLLLVLVLVLSTGRGNVDDRHGRDHSDPEPGYPQDLARPGHQ